MLLNEGSRRGSLGENVPLSHYSLLYSEGRNLILVSAVALLFVLLCCCKGLLGTSGNSLRVGRAMLQSMGVWEEWKEVSLGFTVSTHGVCSAT